MFICKLYVTYPSPASLYPPSFLLTYLVSFFRYVNYKNGKYHQLPDGEGNRMFFVQIVHARLAIILPGDETSEEDKIFEQNIGLDAEHFHGDISDIQVGSFVSYKFLAGYDAPVSPLISFEVSGFIVFAYL